MGGINHCSLHCRLATFRGLMHGGKYGAVIGYRITMAWKVILGTYKKTYFSTNHSAVFTPVHQTTKLYQPNDSVNCSGWPLPPWPLNPDPWLVTPDLISPAPSFLTLYPHSLVPTPPLPCFAQKTRHALPNLYPANLIKSACRNGYKLQHRCKEITDTHMTDSASR